MKEIRNEKKNMIKEKYHGKIYTFNGFGDSNCPVCGREDFDVIHVSERSYCFDSYTFYEFVRCCNCGKRYFFEDGN
ncbi:MAG: hypothetical protein J6P28_03460 [Treponema sp.]|nr:hypothetical protein [Treponema sp.]